MPWLEGPTIGESLRHYRIELLAYAENRCDWIIDLLAEMAQYPYLQKTGFAPGHTFSVSSSSPRRLWDGYVLALPPLDHDSLNPLGVEVDSLRGDRVMWLQVVGLKADELALGIAKGGAALLDGHLKLNEHPEILLLDRSRPSVLAS